MSAQDLTKVTVSGVIDNISAAGQIYLPVPEMFDGTTLTVKNSDGTTIGTLVVPFSGSAAGKTSTINLSGLCRPNEAIEIETNGGSTTAAKCYVTVVIKR